VHSRSRFTNSGSTRSIVGRFDQNLSSGDELTETHLLTLEIPLSHPGLTRIKETANDGMSFAPPLGATMAKETFVSALSRNSGFTLIELMVVVAILTIAVGLALPEFLRWHVQSQLRQASSEIATQLMLARMAAMNRNRSVDVTVQGSGEGVHISAFAPSSGTTVIKDKMFSSRVTSVLGSPVIVSFSSMGMRTTGGSGTQTIGVCDTYQRQYSVSIIPSGKVNWSINPTGTPCP
jgi:prepilin-type N-terminal cleavage/methylation domain-containing protein